MTPVVDPSAFVHPTAVIIGDVIVEAGCYIRPCASLRGGFGRIHVGRASNIQDNCTLHSQPGHEPVIGPNGQIGHGAIVDSARWLWGGIPAKAIRSSPLQRWRAGRRERRSIANWSGAVCGR